MLSQKAFNCFGVYMPARLESYTEISVIWPLFCGANIKGVLKGIGAGNDWYQDNLSPKSN